MFLKEAVERGLLGTAGALSAAGHRAAMTSRVPINLASKFAYLHVLGRREVARRTAAASFPKDDADKAQPATGIADARQEGLGSASGLGLLFLRR